MTIRGTSKWFSIVAVGLVMICAGLWSALAIWFRLMPAAPWREILAGAMLLLTIAAVAGLARQRWRSVALCGACLAGVFGWWATLAPSNDRAWTSDVTRTATGSIEGDRLVVRNVRNFHWRTDTDFDPQWETRSYDLAGLRTVDLVMSYWAGEAIAHTMLSFGFVDGQHLVFSIEIRKEKGEDYSALAGFFRNYELAFIAADERDVIGVRTNVRGEDVRLYRLRMQPEVARKLLVEYVEEANDLDHTPQFYNTLTTNCTTQIFRMARVLRPGMKLDYRMLLTGYVPEYVYDLGNLDTSTPFTTLREKSHIRGKAKSTDPDFSVKIRDGVPIPR